MHHRQLISSGSPWELTVGYSRAVRVDECVWVSGTAAQYPSDQPIPEDPAEQARRCFEIIGEALAHAGGSFADVVRTRLYLTAAEDFDPVAAVHGEIFHDIRPACTAVVVAALLDPRWKVEIEIEAIVVSDNAPMI